MPYLEKLCRVVGVQPPDRLVQRVGVGRRGGRRRSGRGDRRGRAAEIESEVLVERLRIEKGGKDNQKTTTTTQHIGRPPINGCSTVVTMCIT